MKVYSHTSFTAVAAPVGLALLMVGLLLVPVFSVGTGMEYTADIMIYSIMAIGLYVQIACLGLVNFGFSAFFGLGGYVGAMLLMHYSNGLFTSLGLTLGGVALVGTAFGALALKAKGTAFTMITLTFSQLLYVLAVADDRCAWVAPSGPKPGVSTKSTKAAVNYAF